MLGKRGAPALSNVATLAALAVFIIVAWVVIGFTRVGLAGSREVQPAAVSARNDVQATAVSNAAAVHPTVLSRRESIVYVVGGDTTFYHCSVHVMHETQRQAIALSVAKGRGLVPCPICFKGASQ